ncbi:TonB-dependent siderophore receptor [plant metagenome]|uniref:TonB-dependent siderophore receptor n=1 Tax=plant metagenome TaxID=1297885 RepID=A0A484PD07_9ZZZZ|nr:TonB-dependent siderophore receptor [Orrella dioscoreae]
MPPTFRAGTTRRVHRRAAPGSLRHWLAASLVASTAPYAPVSLAEEVADRATQGAAATLRPVTVTGTRPADATSEGTGRYDAPLATVGGKAAVPVREIPNSVSVITRQRMDDQNLVRAEDALVQVTGVTVTPWDGATYQIRSRGYFLEPSLDGVPANGSLNATQQFDLAMFDRIEVLRGPAGLFLGSGQPGGTVNFVRKRAPAEFGGSAAVSYGSWANRRGEVDLGAPLNASGSLRGRVAASLQERNFHYAGANNRKRFVYATLDYDLSPATSFSLYVADQDDKTDPFLGLPAYTDGRQLDVRRSTNPMAPWSRYDTRTRMLGAQAEHRLANGWRMVLQASRAERDWRLLDGTPSAGVNPATGTIARYSRRGWDDESSRVAVDAYATGPFALLGRRHEATLGYNSERYRGETLYGASSDIYNVPIGDPGSVPASSVEPHVRGSGYETRQSGMYGQLRLSVTDPMTVVLGARVSRYATRSRSVAPSVRTDWVENTRESGQVTPHAGIVYRLSPRLSAYASYSEIFMPQSQRDLSGKALDPREGKQVELGVKGDLNGGRLQFSAAVFRTRDVNRSFADPANPGFFLQAGEVEVKGGEVEVSGSPLDGLQLTAGYAYLTSSYVVDRNQAGATFSLFEPRHAVKLYGTQRFAGTPWQASLGLQVSSAVQGTGVSGVREGHGYAIVNTQLGYRVDADTMLALSVNNLLDRRYYARVGTLSNYNFYGEPRSVALTLRTRF